MNRIEDISFLDLTEEKKSRTYAMPKIVGENHIPSERDAEWMIEIQHFQQTFPSDLMQITVGQCAHIRCRLTDTLAVLAPEIVAKHVIRT